MPLGSEGAAPSRLASWHCARLMVLVVRDHSNCPINPLWVLTGWHSVVRGLCTFIALDVGSFPGGGMNFLQAKQCGQNGKR